MVVDRLFLDGLRASSATFPPQLYSARETYLVSQPHDPTGRSDRDERTWHESLNSRPLGGFGEGDLVLLLCRSHAADDDIDTGQSLRKGLLRGFQVASDDFDASFLQSDNGGFLDRSQSDESVNFLRRGGLVSGRTIMSRDRRRRGGTYKDGILKETVGDGAASLTTCANQKNLGLGHDASGRGEGEWKKVVVLEELFNRSSEG